MATAVAPVSAGGREPVVPSPSHTVLCKGAVLPTEADDRWDEQHVRLPCSPKSLYPARQRDGGTQLVQRWSMVQEALQRNINSSAALEDAIKSYNSRYKDKWDFSGLRYFIDEVLADEERHHLFTVTVPQLCRLALRLPELLPAPLPLLARHRSHSVSLSQLQVASLLANAFLCTFPRRNSARRGQRPAEYSNYPDINFNRLFCWSGGRRSGTAGLSQRRVEKLKCLLHYFHRVLRREPTGVLTFSRRFLSPSELPDWSASEARLPALSCHSEGLIEDQLGSLQVDFANKFVGGGVLGDGCVQEEIRFLINPELIVARLFTEVLDATECLVVTGCERFSQFEGYADTFKWTAKATDPSPLDEFGRRSTQVVALDAVHFTQPQRQYMKHFLLREMNKAYVGFSWAGGGPLPPVATGNWGCGAFNGDPHLKALLQLMAAALAGREVIYLTFGDEMLRDKLLDIHAFLRERNVTVGALHKALLEYGRLYDGHSQRPDLLRFVRHRLAGGAGSDYGSDTDAEMEPEPGPEPGPEQEGEPEPGPEPESSAEPAAPEPAAAPQQPEESQESLDVESEARSACESDVTAEMEPEQIEDRQPAGTESEATNGVKRVRRRTDSDSDSAVAAGRSAPAAAADSGDATQQFARFEVISETSRARTVSRQAKITSYLKK
ncbi:poly(ADP-ribose) glycohydrolase-like isoform X2 [Amphibalanus amphitrite]|uniref:poly(ADP-ribose) glycohydrolase-like isoform X2 n=1 Tax=Amphibalanus amphitrite TaxID=1232801 RepID=UPI001C916652|nr:poly(ADP-ribose) glycohydrolase-like isoform X2 [Amphibalanus amphitrite]